MGIDSRSDLRTSARTSAIHPSAQARGRCALLVAVVAVVVVAAAFVCHPHSSVTSQSAAASAGDYLADRTLLAVHFVSCSQFAVAKINHAFCRCAEISSSYAGNPLSSS